MLYFTADTHFYHENVIKYCNRPFKDVHDMNESLIANWNSRVGPTDDVIHVGDFAFTSVPKTLELIRRLNGRIHLVKGNHDRVKGELYDRKKGFASVHSLYEFKSTHFNINGPRQRIVACHYAMRRWNCAHHGAWHVYGHSHGGLEPYGKSWDVGVDNNGYYPISYNELKVIMDGLEKIGHHE